MFCPLCPCLLIQLCVRKQRRSFSSFCLGMFSVAFGRVDVPISIVNTFLLNEMIKHTF